MVSGHDGSKLDRFSPEEESYMSLKLTVTETEGVSVVEVVGRITLGEGSSALRDTVRELAKNGKKNILLNLAKVDHIDSSGMGELISAFVTVTNQGGQIKLVNLTKKVHDLLQITKLYTVFEIFDSEVTAIRSFKFGQSVARA
jgi:anti-sigma B factor antagonist